MAELQEVDARLDALLAGLEPAARKRMMRELAQQPRRSQQKNIRMQRNPDGTALRAASRDGQNETGPHPSAVMFTKLRTTKYLKAVARSRDAGQASSLRAAEGRDVK